MHRDGFYQFEPLHPFYRNGCEHNLTLKYESLLQKLRCQFENRYNTSKEWKTVKNQFNEEEKIDARSLVLYSTKFIRNYKFQCVQYSIFLF